MATNPKMAERIKREAPRCKYIKNVDTEEIYRNTGNPADRWLIIYEHAVKNPETFERVFHEAKATGGAGETKTMETPGSLVKKAVPVLREMAGTMGIKDFSNKDKKELIESILARQEDDLAKLNES